MRGAVASDAQPQLRLPAGLKLYFIRHGQTDWNFEGRLQGQRDIPLNATGRAQAKRNGHMLAELLGDAVSHFDFVASPLGRTRETMEILREALGLPLARYRMDDRLKEICFGDWEGITWKELKKSDRAAYDARYADPWGTRGPGGGESYADVAARIAAWASELSADTVVVSHGGVNRCLRAVLLDLPRAEVPQLEVPQDQIMLVEGGSISWV